MSSDPMNRLRALMGDEYLQSENAKTRREGVGTSRACVTTSAEQDNFSQESYACTQSIGSGAACFNPATAPPPQPTISDSTPDKALHQYGRQRGELAPVGQYCPIMAVSKFPYKFMNPQSNLSKEVSQYFFAENRFWDRPWTLYYMHLPPSLFPKHLILVPDSEVRELIAQISAAFKTCINFPELEGFSTGFRQDGAPSPRFLGMSKSKNDFQLLSNEVPTVCLDFSIMKDGEIQPKCDQETFRAWVNKVEGALEATKKNDKASRARKKDQRVLAKTEWLGQLRRTQRYLGLRSRNNTDGPSESLASLDINKPAPRDFDSDVIFIAVDVEVNERNHMQLLEIGVAVLDSWVLCGVPPGELGKPWQKEVRARHLLIKENSHLQNRDFVIGCPEDFELQFGVTERVSLYDAKKILTHCFESPMTAFNLNSRPFSSGHRNIVLVGHGIDSDIDYLKSSIGFDLVEAPHVLEIIDTSDLYLAMTHTEQRPSVGGVLHELDIVGWHLHNAGNDAAYTLQILAGIVAKSVSQASHHQDSVRHQLAKAKMEAEERVLSSIEEWKLASEDQKGDGGVATGPHQRRRGKSKGK